MNEKGACVEDDIKEMSGPGWAMSFRCWESLYFIQNWKAF